MNAPTRVPAVDAVVRAAGPSAEPLLAAVETRLREIAAAAGPVLAPHARATVEAGGKRLRPLLVILAAGEAPEREEALVRAGVAVELVHSATLVHDDVLDGAALRRGRPSVFAAGGRDAAIETGDHLFARAFAELVRNRSANQIRALSDASEQLARGELLQREDAWNAAVPLERYLLRCELKTASLFAASCRLGALEGGGPEGALASFGTRIGIAFQLLDDVLDVAGPPERTGKPRGTDLLDGTVTLPLILARARDPQLAALDPRSIEDPDAASEICDRIAGTGALEEARSRALRVVAEAKAALPAGLPPAQRRALELVADSVVERYS